MAEDQVKSLQESLEKAEKEMTTIKGSVKDNDELINKIGEAEARIKDLSTNHQKELQEVEKKYAVLTDLRDPQKHKCNIADLLLGKIDLDKVIIKDGKVIAGLDEQVEVLKQSYPTGFSKVDIQTETPEDKGGDPKPKLQQLKDELGKATKLEEKIALTRQISEIENKR